MIELFGTVVFHWICFRSSWSAFVWIDGIWRIS